MLITACALLFLQNNPATSENTERNIEFNYRFTVNEIPKDCKKLAVWIPMPPNTKRQQVKDAHAEGGLTHTILNENEYGNRFIYMDLSDKLPIENGSLTISWVFQVQRKAYRVLGDSAPVEAADNKSMKRFLSPDKLVPIDGKIAQEASKVAGESKETLEKARKLYDNVVTTLKYDKSGQGWGKGDANFACDVRKGNCTDFHSLFIGEARSLGIPARFIMGFPISETAKEGNVGGYHCWAEFYVEGKGWIPVDASEASKDLSKKEKLFGGLDASRIEFTMGRDVELSQSSAGRVNFFIYPFIEIDGKQHTKVQNQFSFKEFRP